MGEDKAEEKIKINNMFETPYKNIRHITNIKTGLKQLKCEEYDYIKPNHYKLWEGMEPFELHRKLLNKIEYIGFLKGNILKYKLRIGNKPGESIERDMEKIKVYQEELKKFLKK